MDNYTIYFKNKESQSDENINYCNNNMKTNFLSCNKHYKYNKHCTHIHSCHETQQKYNLLKEEFDLIKNDNILNKQNIAN